MPANETVLEFEYEDDATATLVAGFVDEAVVPGDSGSVTMRPRLLSGEGVDAENTANAELYLLVHLSNTAENGINEPERDAGDTSPNDGELEDFTRITLWEEKEFAQVGRTARKAWFEY